MLSFMFEFFYLMRKISLWRIRKYKQTKDNFNAYGLITPTWGQPMLPGDNQCYHLGVYSIRNFYNYIYIYSHIYSFRKPFL